MDLQLANDAYPNLWMFIEHEIKRGVLTFVVEHERWNAENEENDHVKTERVPAAEFSEWWKRQILVGWKIINS